ncbi:MAG: S9 family peptidase [Myxococcales bacterium]|nr:S9 family peptidase [Myxococcales bacterium]
MRTHSALVAFATLLASCSSSTPAPKSPAPKAGSAKAAPAKPATTKPVAKRPAATLAKEQPSAVPPACADYDKKIAAAHAPYLDAFSNRGRDLSRDGKVLLFSSNRAGGAPQLYIGDVRRPGKKPVALAPAKDRAGGGRFLPDGKHVVFTRDKDNNENWQIYLVGVDGTGLRALTNAPQRFHQAPDLTPDGKTMVYFRGERRSPVYELVAHDIASGKVRSLIKARGFHFVSDVSRDGKQVLITRLNSQSHSKTVVVDIESGKERVLYPPAGKTAHAHSATFSADGKSIYVVSDLGSERADLRRVDVASGKVLATFKHPRGELLAPLTGPKGKLVAAAVQMGSHTEVVLLDARTLRRKVRVRQGVGTNFHGRFDGRGRQLIINSSTPAKPADVFAVDTRSGRMRALRRDRRAGLGKLARVKVQVLDVPTFDDNKVPLNVYLPRKRARGAKLPVLVNVHGGPASASTVRWNSFVAFFIGRGWAVVEPNVRGSTGFGKTWEKADNMRKRMDSVKDLGAVNDWVRKQPWADAERIVVFGSSYGGYMTYMALGHQPDKWRAGVGLVGVVNLRTFLEHTSGAIRHIFRDEFGTLEKDGPFLDEVSPITVVDRFKAPLFVYQGATDPRVPRSEQDQLVRKLRRRGHAVEYMVAPDEGHSMNHRHNRLEFIGRITRFLDVFLARKGPSEACVTAMKGKRAAK